MPKVSSDATAAKIIDELREKMRKMEATQIEAQFELNRYRAEAEVKQRPINSANPTNGQGKNDFLPWMGGILDPSSPFFLPLGKNFPIQIINHSRMKESKDYGKQWLFDVVIHHPATNSVTGAGKFTWSMKVDDARIGRIIDLLAAGKPVLIYRQEYLDTKTNITKSTIKIA